jgi:hypothetical protein
MAGYTRQILPLKTQSHFVPTTSLILNSRRQNESFFLLIFCFAPIITKLIPLERNCEMSPSRDPFGFSPKASPQSPQGTNPLVVMAQPGQEIRVVITDDGTIGGVSQGSPDSNRASPDSNRASPDSGRASPDLGAQNPFGFQTFQPGFSPTPVTVIARRGQEIRIIVPDQPGSSGT